MHGEKLKKKLYFLHILCPSKLLVFSAKRMIDYSYYLHYKTSLTFVLKIYYTG